MATNRKTRGRVISMASKQWKSDVVGLFYEDGGIRLDDAFDLGGWAWVKDAACRDTSPEAWFEQYHADEDLLAHICQHCTVRTDCLEQALKNGERGWWGGTSEKDRRQLKRQQKERTDVDRVAVESPDVDGGG